MSITNTRTDDGRRHMAKMKCPVCGKRVIDFSDATLRRESTLVEFSKASGKIDLVLTCPNKSCGADIALYIESLHTTISIQG